MTSSSKRRRLDYDPSDPDIQLGSLNLQEMLLFLRQVWNSVMRDCLYTLLRIAVHQKNRCHVGFDPIKYEFVAVNTSQGDGLIAMS